MKRLSTNERRGLVLSAFLSLLGGTALQGCSSETGGGTGGSATGTGGTGGNSTTSSSSTTSSTSTSGGPTCGGGHAVCGGACADLQNDPANCGACGTACDAGLVCSQGACVLDCLGGTTKCGDACVDTQLDPANCGACGTACAVGEVCSQGQCALQCVGGATKCGASCVDTQSDPNNCGACGMTCDAGQVCASGACTLACAGGTTQCGAACVDTNTDPANCGDCDNACSANEYCSGGACTATCDGTVCGGACVDVSTNHDHCGSCTNACATSQVCQSGACACPAGASACGNACVDLSGNSLNCGACGTACGANQVCSAGVCVTPTAGNGGFTKTPLTGLAMPKVAVLAATGTNPDYGKALQTALQATGKFSQVDAVNVNNAGGALPTVAQMQAYDAVAVFTQTQPQGTGLGDNLAAYFESGGGVLLFDYAAQFNTVTTALVGRFEAQYTLSTQTIDTSANLTRTAVTLGTILEPASPIMAGVFSFGYPGSNASHFPASVFSVSANNPVVVAKYLEDGLPAVIRGTVSAPVAAGRHLVEINGFGGPAPTAGIISVGWDPTSDGAVLIANALEYTLPVPSIGMEASRSFGSQALYTQSAPQTVTYTNVSSVPQTISSISLAGAQISDFAIVPASALPVTLQPGDTFVVNVTFDPSDTGLRAATLHAAVQGVGVDATTLLTGSGT